MSRDLLMQAADALKTTDPVLAAQVHKAAFNYPPSTKGMGLTARQRDLLNFIRSYSKMNRGQMPTFEEMRRALGLKSKSAIHRIIIALEERGHIHRIPTKARAMELV
jgi:DNA-binding MarR family transcriptional regulator